MSIDRRKCEAEAVVRLYTLEDVAGRAVVRLG